MFEALRGLRDAVAPESGNLGGEGANTNENELDFDEFWGAWRKGDKVRQKNVFWCIVIASQLTCDSFFTDFLSFSLYKFKTIVDLVAKISPTPPRQREDFVRVYAKIESLKDATLVKRLAGTVLEKSADIDDSVSALPGMHRTRSQQMEYIEELLKKNQEVADTLEEKFDRAKQRRDLVRNFVKDQTCTALGIVEDTD